MSNAERALSRWLPFCAAALIVAVAVIALFRSGPPSPKPATAPADQFSAARAADTLGRVLGPGVAHPTGSPENRAVRQRIVAELEQLGLEPDVQRQTVCGRYGACAGVENVVARRKGRLERPALMLAAHYDSVPAGPGAADDGAGVATLLEVARALTGGPEQEHSVIFLFDDGEEAGLLGAEAFVRAHPFARDVAVAVNVEARGTEGATLMFETSNHNASLIRAYARSVPRPVTSSLFRAVYRQLPNDTDLTVFMRRGMAGLNLAAVGGVARYHTPLDDLAHLDRGTLQQHGDTTLALARELGNDLPSAAGGDAVYTDLLAFRVLFWPIAATRFVFFSILGLLAAATVLGVRRGLLAPARLARRALGWPFAPVVATLLGAAAFGLVAHADKLPSWPAEPLPAYGVMAGTALSSVLAPLALAKTTDPWHELFAALGWWALFAGVSCFAVPEGSYLFLLPLGVGATLTLVAFARPDVAQVSELALVAPALIAGAIWFPLLRLMDQALGFELPALLVLVAVLSLTLLAPALSLLPRRPRRLALSGAAALLGASTLAALLVAPYSADSPERASLAFAYDASAGSSRYLLDASSKPLPESLIRAGRFARTPVDPAPWLGGFLPEALEAPGPDVRISPPELTIESESERDGVRTVHASIRSTRDAHVLTLHFSPAAQLMNATLAGENATPRRGVQYQSLTFLGDAGHGVELELVIAGPKTSVIVSDETPGLPEAAAALLAARPKSLTPSQFGDATVASRRIEL
jgi:Peptidase family M28